MVPVLGFLSPGCKPQAELQPRSLWAFGESVSAWGNSFSLSAFQLYKKENIGGFDIRTCTYLQQVLWDFMILACGSQE